MLNKLDLLLAYSDVVELANKERASSRSEKTFFRRERI